MKTQYAKEKSRWVGPTLGLGLLLSLSTSVLGGVVDEFTEFQTVYDSDTTVVGGVTNSSFDNLSFVLGGQRDINVDLIVTTSPTRNSTLTIEEPILGTGGVLSFNNDSTARGKALVQWDGPDQSINLVHTGLGEVDLTENGTVGALDFGFLEVDLLQGFYFRVEAYTDSDNYSIVELYSPQILSPTPISLPFDLFQACNQLPVIPGVLEVISVSCGVGVANEEQPVDFAKFGALQLALNTKDPDAPDPTWPASSLDVTISKITTPPTLAALGDYVWEDNNNDGIQDGNESGIAGATVNLYTCSGLSVDSTNTDASGKYNFSSLTPNSYYLEFITPAGYDTPTLQDANGNSQDNVDSDADPFSGLTACTDLVAGEVDNSWDAGFIPTPGPASLGDYVWLDSNGNGIQDGTELGFAGVEVRLYICGNATAEATMFTDSTGFYQFTNLVPGDYFVEFIAPAGFDFTSQDQGADDTADSDANQLSARTDCTTLSPGENDPTWDAGLVEEELPASLGDYAWEDTNGNGIQDGVEVGIADVEVRLYICGSTVPEATMFTDATGFYQFTNLTPGDYFVEFIKPVGFDFSQKDVGADDSTDSDADQVSGRTDCTTLTSGENDTTLDAGLVPEAIPASLGNYVWEDINANGIQDGVEVGIAGVEVRLYICGSATFETSMLTDADGFYQFTNLAADSYYVEFVAPTGYAISQMDAGADDAVDSDANPATGQTDCVQLLAGDNNDTVDAGMYRPASIGDFVWIDFNQDGIQDAGEPGFDGVTVRLLDCIGNVYATTVTAANGFYEFAGLVPGGYVVEFITPDMYTLSPQGQGSFAELDSDAGGNGQTNCVTLSSGEDRTDIDAGMFIPTTAMLGDYVWEDLNADGIQDLGEPGIAGVTVNLLTCQGVSISSTITGSDGGYLFDNLAPGGYIVNVDVPFAYNISPRYQGADAANDSNIDTSMNSECVTLAVDEVNRTIDAGLYRNASLGDRVWNDLNQDGIQDGNESGVSGITVNLYDCENNLLTSTTTNGNGNYLFQGLMPGGYTVEFINLTGWVFSPANQGANETVDSDVEQTGKTTCVTLASNETNLDVDAGVYLPPAPAIMIEKATNGHDADLPTGPSIPVGGLVEWTYVVTNTGNVMLSNVIVSDDQGVNVSCPKTTLAVNESMTCTANGTAIEGQYANIGTVTGTPPIGPNVSANDPSHYFGAGVCDLLIDKSVTPDTIYVDGGTSYSDGSTVYSDGSTSYSDGSTSHSDGSTSYSDGSTIYSDGSTSYRDGSTSYSDGSTSYSDGTTIDSDGSTSYDGDSSYDNDSGSGICPSGHEVVYTYVISNNGGDLTNLMLSDDKLGQIMLPATTLASNASVTVTEASCIEETTTNVALVTGNLVTGELCSATDSATVTVMPTEPEPGCDSDSSYSWSGGWGMMSYDSDSDSSSDDSSDGGACVTDGDSSYEGDSSSDSDSNDSDSNSDDDSNYSWSGGWSGGWSR